MPGRSRHANDQSDETTYSVPRVRYPAGDCTVCAKPKVAQVVLKPKVAQFVLNPKVAQFVRHPCLLRECAKWSCPPSVLPALLRPTSLS